MANSKYIPAVAGTIGLIAIGGGVMMNASPSTRNEAQSTAVAPPEPAATPAEPAAIVHVERAVATNLAPLAEAPGSVVSTRDSLVAAAASGKIQWIADIGAEVAEGDVIARIDQADAILARDDAQAAIRRLEARAQYLASLYGRFEGLGEDAGESEAAMDEMRSNWEEARQQVESARVALRRAETTLERTSVRAPFSGRIVSQAIQIGEFASPGAAIARLVDTERLEISAQAPASLLSNVHSGNTVEVARGAVSLDAPVRAVIPVSDEISRTLELRLTLPAETPWHIGSAVRVKLPAAAPRKVVAASRDALILRSNRISVFKIDADNMAHQIDVRLGAGDGDLIELMGDIHDGDQLVVRGGERLRDGQYVTIADRADALAI